IRTRPVLDPPRSKGRFFMRAGAVVRSSFLAGLIFAAGSGNHVLAQVPEQATIQAAGDIPTVVNGYGDAMDRLTKEFRAGLKKGKLLVVWVMDQSESMQDDRDEIMARIDRVYSELGLSAAAGNDSLLTGVVSYGAIVLNHTPRPTARPEQIAAAFKAV